MQNPPCDRYFSQNMAGSPMNMGDMFPKLQPKRRLDKANNKTPRVERNGTKWCMFDQPTNGEIHPQREWTHPNLGSSRMKFQIWIPNHFSGADPEIGGKKFRKACFSRLDAHMAIHLDSINLNDLLHDFLTGSWVVNHGKSMQILAFLDNRRPLVILWKWLVHPAE